MFRLLKTFTDNLNEKGEIKKGDLKEILKNITKLYATL